MWMTEVQNAYSVNSGFEIYFSRKQVSLFEAVGPPKQLKAISKPCAEECAISELRDACDVGVIKKCPPPRQSLKCIAEKCPPLAKCIHTFYFCPKEYAIRYNYW